MNRLQVSSLPPKTTSQDLRLAFGRIGPVVDAKVFHDGKGQCLAAIVDMLYKEDLEEILTTMDRISIGGRRPNIWRAAEYATIGERIKAEHTGTHLEHCQTQWYVFEVRDNHLLWCLRLPENEAVAFYNQYLNRSCG